MIHKRSASLLIGCAMRYYSIIYNFFVDFRKWR